MLKKDQERAVYSNNKYICVSASAGTGKTMVLVERYLNLLESEQLNLDEIVALTFTRNSTAEMKERVRQKVIEKLNSGENHDYWNRIYRKIDTARISSFHSFYSEILRRFPFDAGIDPEFTILEDSEESYEQVAEVMRDVLFELQSTKDPDLENLLRFYPVWSLKDKLMVLYNFRQKLHEFMKYPKDLTAKSPVMSDNYIAGYKESLGREIVMSVEWHRLTSKAEQALARHSSKDVDGKKAVGKKAELETRLKALTQYSPENLNTYDKVKEFITSNSENVPTGSAPFREYPFLHDYADVLVDAQKFLQGSQDIVNNSGVENVDAARSIAQSLVSVYARIENRVNSLRNSASSLDFNDLALKARKLIYEKKHVRERLRAQIKHLLVDEFQDTDGLQLDIITALTDLNPDVSTGGSHPSLFVVGDSKQSIYRFRGADVTVFDKISNLVNDAGGETINLETNFRSTGDLIEFHNHFIPSFMPERKINQYEAEYIPAVANKPNQKRLSVEFLLQMKPEAADETEDEVKSYLDKSYILSTAANMEGLRAAEAKKIATKILGLVNSGDLLISDDEGNRPVTYSDIALLFNSMSSFEIYEDIFRKAGIPFKRLETRNFLTLPEIMDFNSLLKSVDNPGDDIALASLLKGPLCGLSDYELHKLFSLAKDNTTLWELINSGGKIPLTKNKSRVEFLISLLKEKHMRKDSGSLMEFINSLAEESGILDIYSAVRGSEEKVRNLKNYIIYVLPGLISSGFDTLNSLCSHLTKLHKDELAGNAVPLSGTAGGSVEDNAVQIMTIHRAKGLQFPVVFVPNLSQETRHSSPLFIDSDAGLGFKWEEWNPAELKYEDIKPLNFLILKDLNKRRELAEKRRLMYVAATRAKDLLFFSGSIDRPGSKIYIRLLEEFLPGGRYFENCPPELKPVINFEVDEFNRIEFPESAKSIARGETKQESITGGINPDILKPLPLTMSNKARFSPSELLTYRDCPRMYYLSYVKRIPEPEPRKKGNKQVLNALEFGTFVHGVLERHEGEEPPEREYELLRLSEEETGKVKEKVTRMLEDFRASEVYPLLKEAETAKHELPFALKLEDAYIEGKIDLLLEHSGMLHIIDYKTDRINRNQVHTRAEHHIMQLEAYAAAAARIYNNTRVKCWIMFLEPGVAWSRDYDSESLLEAETGFKELITSIRNEVKWEHNNDRCPCYYEKLCDTGVKSSG